MTACGGRRPGRDETAELPLVACSDRTQSPHRMSAGEDSPEVTRLLEVDGALALAPE